MLKEKKNVTKIKSHYIHQYEIQQERLRRKKKRLKTRLILLAMIVFLIIGSMTTYHFSQRDLRQAKVEQYDQLQNELKTLKKQENSLKEEIQLLNDEEYLLDLARTNYFFSKKGEIIFTHDEDDPSN
ncbi:cell division protein DivIC [Cerasibacillus quisquiliarum]|uniref:Cell division protein DIVIC n=1 Tax=Cerasibacillus quisquiliarum TaxID=227865 RepID=A0A511UZZ7_9BACI|nr:septum formation initiator family protein [Cerasibacillus quisquiliarum]MBB5146589.1 cell division protein DivIC [Cerasibacillus quisquiliarum]GEN31288.1 cell division protein DIVIC [Cerasibacillus quisquiliarum]